VPSPILVRLGPLAIRWYGVLIVSGALAAAYFSSREAARRGHDPEIAWDMLIWVLFWGIVGARLYHVVSSPVGGNLGWSYYRQHPLEALMIWRGGLGIYGALAGGIFGVATYAWRHHLDLVEWLDIVAPNVLLAQAFGRWGNFFNQEAYGYPTNLPWGIYIDPSHRLPGLEQYSHYHPLFLYESLACLLAFVLLTLAQRRWLRTWLLRGDMLALYFASYGAIRTFTESLRPDAWRVGGWPTAQIISLAAVAVSLLYIALRHTLKPHPKEQTQSPSS